MDKIPSQLFSPILIVLIFLMTACGGSESPVYTTISETTLKAGDAIPVPTENTILTIRGDIGTTNQDDHIVMDVPTIESVGLVEYTLLDPFEEEDITYRGVLMSDLLDLWQVGDNATLLSMTALNDYKVDVPIDMLREFPIIFAMQANGEYMTISEKGPAMLVLPYDDYEFEQPFSNQYWIWQIKSIEVQ